MSHASSLASDDGPDDLDFFEAHDALLAQVVKSGAESDAAFIQPAGMNDDDWLDSIARVNRLLARDPEECARIMVGYAEANDDPDAWKFIAARMDDFVRQGRPPPFAFIKAINDALARWRAGESIAVVFGEKRGALRNGRRPGGLTKLAWKRTNAQLMDYFINAQSMSEDAAAQKVAEFRGRHGEPESIPTYKRDYKLFFKK